MKRLNAAARYIAALIAVTLVLSACRVDVAIDVEVTESGASTVTVTALADAWLLAQVPRLLDDLSLSDLAAVGWRIDGPQPTADGGVRVVLQREARDLEDLAAVLADVGAPLSSMRVVRADEFARSSWELSGRSVLHDGTAALVDPEALSALGAAPFAAELNEAGVTLAEVMTLTLRMRLPGDLVSTTGDARDGVITWSLPVDGTQVSLQAFSERTDRGATVARTVADITRFVLVVWVLVGVTFMAWVFFARSRRRRARRHRATPPA
jgi:hypothetical protein